MSFFVLLVLAMILTSFMPTFAGTHGKTTTSGFSSFVLDKAGLEPSFVVGGIVPEIHTNAQCKNGKFFIAELDESDNDRVYDKMKAAGVNVELHKFEGMCHCFQLFSFLPESSRAYNIIRQRIMED